MFLHRSLRKSSEIHSLLVLRLSLTIRVYLHSLLPLLPFKLLSLLTCRCTKYFALHLQDVCHCPPGCSQARYRAVTVTSAVNTSSMKVLLQKCKTFAVTGTWTWSLPSSGFSLLSLCTPIGHLLWPRVCPLFLEPYRRGFYTDCPPLSWGSCIVCHGSHDTRRWLQVLLLCPTWLDIGVSPAACSVQLLYWIFIQEPLGSLFETH